MERNFFNNQQDSNTQGDSTPDGTNSPTGNTTGRNPQDRPSKGHIVIHCTQGIGEIIQKICRKYGIQTHFKGNRTIKELLVKPKDKDPMDMKSGAIYLYQCGEPECDEEYTGETSRTLGKRYKEHLKEPSPIYVQSTQTGHNTTPKNLNIIGREDHGLARTLKESIYIRVNNPTFHRNVGKYNLHHIWDRDPEFKINNDNGHAHITTLSGHAQSIPSNRHLHRTFGHTGYALNSEHAQRTSKNIYTVQ